MDNKQYISKIKFVGLIEDDALILSENNDAIIDEIIVDDTEEGVE